MARPEKTGIDYYPLEVGFLKERRMHSLIKKYGSDAIAVFIHILNEGYENKGYYLILDADFYDFATDVIYITEDRIREIISQLCNKGFFQMMRFDGEMVLTSKGMQERFLNIIKSLRRKSEFHPIPQIWLLQGTENINVCNNPKNEGFPTPETVQKPPESTQIKRKEKKGKEIKTKEKVPVWFPFNYFSFDEMSAVYDEGQIRDAVEIARRKGDGYTSPEYVWCILKKKSQTGEPKDPVKRPDPNCKKCRGTGWVISRDKDGYDISSRCECLK